MVDKNHPLEIDIKLVREGLEQARKVVQEGYIEGAMHLYVGHLEEHLNEVPKDQPIAVICNVGHRASLGASILRRGDMKKYLTF